MEVFKIFSTKVSYFMMLYELTINECFFLHLSVGEARSLSMGLSDVQFIFVERSFISLMIEKLFL